MRRIACAAAASLWLAGCGNLLPRGSTATPSSFQTFAQAQAALEQIEPFRTRAGQLPQLGFDPVGGANVTVIPYPELLGRLAPYPGVAMQELDPGIQQCIRAQAGCSAWLFRFERQSRRREGGFWADFLNIRRITHVQGWWFEALVVTSGGTVLFRNFAGQPQIERTDRQTNPLGPLQPAGESAGAVLLR